MAFLARSEIEKLANSEVESTGKKLFLKDTFDPKMLQQCSYDLRLGSEVYIVGNKVPDRLTRAKDYISLPPGQFAMLTCHEWLAIPSHLMAFITLRSSFKFQGLVNISGFHVDPTFEGKLLFAVQNVGPSDIRLRYLDPTFTIFFAEVQGSTGSGRDRAPLSGIRLQDVQSLGGGSVSLAKLKKELDTVRLMVLVYGPFAVAAFIALLINLFKVLTTPAH
jgi:dCTP deaminase